MLQSGSMVKIEFDPDTSMVELIEAARREWARANIGPTESYFAFAKRLGVSYRTILRWLGKLSTRERIVRKALRRPVASKPEAFDIALPIPLTWNKNEIKSYLGPVAYMVMKDEQPVYVGSSSQGASRVLSTSQHDHHDVIKNASAILFYPCPTKIDAKRLESQLIRQYQPLFNVNQT